MATQGFEKQGFRKTMCRRPRKSVMHSDVQALNEYILFKSTRIYIIQKYILHFSMRASFKKRLYNIHTHIPIQQRSQPYKVTSSSSGVVRVRRLAHGNLDTRNEPGIQLATFRLVVHPPYLLR